jgi:hypothetical protein
MPRLVNGVRRVRSRLVVEVERESSRDVAAEVENEKEGKL